jgi:hypothetical protein
MPKQKITNTATMNADFPARFLPMIFIEGCSRSAQLSVPPPLSLFLPRPLLTVQSQRAYN